MSKLRDSLIDSKARLIAEMQAAIDAAVAPYRAELEDIEIALEALERRTRPISQVSRNWMSDGKTLETELPRRSSKGRLSPSSGMTVKEMIVAVLRDHPEGAEAMSILDEINTRWNLNLARTSLSPQMSRLKADQQISLIGKTWSLVQKHETPSAEAHGVRDVGVAGSPGESSWQRLPVGSTPITSTHPSLPLEDRKEET